MVWEISITSWWSSRPNSRATSASLSASIMIEAFSAPVSCVDGSRSRPCADRLPSCSQPRTTRTASSGLASIALPPRPAATPAPGRGRSSGRPAPPCRPAPPAPCARPARAAASAAIGSRTTTGLPARSTPMVAPVAPCTSSGLPSAPSTTAVALGGGAGGCTAASRRRSAGRTPKNRTARVSALSTPRSTKRPYWARERVLPAGLGGSASAGGRGELAAHHLDHVAAALVDAGGAAHQRRQLRQLLGAARLVGSGAVGLLAVDAVDLHRDRQPAQIGPALGLVADRARDLVVDGLLGLAWSCSLLAAAGSGVGGALGRQVVGGARPRRSRWLSFWSLSSSVVWVLRATWLCGSYSSAVVATSSKSRSALTAASTLPAPTERSSSCTSLARRRSSRATR